MGGRVVEGTGLENAEAIVFLVFRCTLASLLILSFLAF